MEKILKERNVINEKGEIIFTEQKPYSSIIVGKRNTGKSYCAEYLMKHFCGNIVIFSGTYVELSNGVIIDPFENIDGIKFSGYDEDYCEDIPKMQDEHYNELGYYPPILCVFDDVISKETKSSQPLQSLFCFGRHRNISCIFISQSPSHVLHPVWKSNCDYFIFFKCPGKTKYVIEYVESEITIDIIKKSHRIPHQYIIFDMSIGGYSIQIIS
jgi:hypothetical protein